MAQPKWLKLVVEVLEVRVEMCMELTMHEILLENLEVLADMQELFTKQLKETKGFWKALLAIRFAINNVMEQMSWMEQGSRKRNNRARSV